MLLWQGPIGFQATASFSWSVRMRRRRCAYTGRSDSALAPDSVCTTYGAPVRPRRVLDCLEPTAPPVTVIAFLLYGLGRLRRLLSPRGLSCDGARPLSIRNKEQGIPARFSRPVWRPGLPRARGRGGRGTRGSVFSCPARDSREVFFLRPCSFFARRPCMRVSESSDPARSSPARASTSPGSGGGGEEAKAGRFGPDSPGQLRILLTCCAIQSYNLAVAPCADETEP